MGTHNIQGDLWSTAAEDWALYLETTFIPVYKKTIFKSALSANHHVLDIGCGSGLFLSMAAAKNAHITGIDLSDALLEIAKERSPGAILLNQDMADLPFENLSFDLVTCFNVLQYSQNVQQVLKEIKSVLKDDGKMVIGVWGNTAECESLAIINAIASLMPETAAGTPGPLALSGKGEIEMLLKAAGFTIIENATIECPWNFSSLNEAIKGIMAAGPTVEAIHFAGKEKVTQKLINTLKAYNTEEGVYILENVIHYYIASKNKN